MRDATHAESPAPTDSQTGKPRLRIAIVTETYPPEVNGVAQTIAKVVEGLSESGHEITLVRPNQNEPARPLAPNMREVLVVGVPIPKYGQLKMGLPAMNRLTRLWRSQRPDVVHIVTEGPLGLSALLAARRLGLPVCSEFRTNFHAYCAHYGIGWLARPIIGYLRWFHNRTGCTMAPTRALAAELAAEGFDNLRVVARGVDTQLFDPAKRRPDLRQSWGAAGNTRLADEKNLPVMFAAFDRVRQIRPDSRLVLVGDGPARQELERRYPHAIFAGIRKGEELARHYASGDLFLFPSLTETFGNVTPEAMASGLAVVAYDRAAASELIQSGENGLLAEPGNDRQFADRAAYLAEHAAELGRMRCHARMTVFQLGWPSIIDRIVQVYRTEIRKTAPARTTTEPETAFPLLDQRRVTLK